MDIIARITCKSTYTNNKYRGLFKLEKKDSIYVWRYLIELHYNKKKNVKPLLNFYYKSNIKLINGDYYLKFREWHLSKWAIRFNGCDRKNK